MSSPKDLALDNKPYVVNSIFASALRGAREKHGRLDEKEAKKAVLSLCEKIINLSREGNYDSRKFWDYVCATIKSCFVPFEQQKCCRSFLSHYSKKGGFRQAKEVPLSEEAQLRLEVAAAMDEMAAEERRVQEIIGIGTMHQDRGDPIPTEIADEFALLYSPDDEPADDW